MIRSGIRQSFDRIEQIEDRYANLSVPVEVALPYYWDIYEPVRGRLTEITEKIKSYETEVLSIQKFRKIGIRVQNLFRTLILPNSEAVLMLKSS